MSLQALGYFLFVVCTGLLFVRPTELVESLNDAPLYEVAILCGLAVAAPCILAQLTVRALKTNSITVCVLGLVPAAALSHLSQFAPGEAVQWTFAFLKLALSYLFLVAVLNTTERLRGFLFWLLVFIFVLTALALLQHYEVIDNPALAAHQEKVFDKESGAAVGLNVRLCGAGIFANPNDLSRILTVGIALALYFFDGGAPKWLRPVWLAAIGMLGHALLLTQSRGGFLGLLATLFVVCWFRFGSTRTVILSAAALPVMLLAIEGRQTELSTTDGTGQQRIRLWSDGLEAFRAAPAFGIGMGNYAQVTGHLGAHNSFVQVYVELGFFGGTLFTVAVFCALWAGRSSVHNPPVGSDTNLQKIGGYAVAILAGYTVGMMTAHRAYAFPTYYLLGFVVAYVRVAGANVVPPALRTTPRLAGLAVALSALILLALQVYVMSAARFGTQIF